MSGDNAGRLSGIKICRYKFDIISRCQVNLTDIAHGKDKAHDKAEPANPPDPGPRAKE